MRYPLRPMMAMKPQSTVYDCIRLSWTWTGFWSDTIVTIASDFMIYDNTTSLSQAVFNWSVVIVRLVRDHRIKVGGRLGWSQTSRDDWSQVILGQSRDLLKTIKDQ